MSSFLCFICHSTVNMDTNKETRDKYKELIGMHLHQDSHLCHICCHVLKRFWLFRSVCLKRSMEYPVLFSEKGTIYLTINDIEHFNLCLNYKCQNGQYKSYHNPAYHFNDTNHSSETNDDQNDNISLKNNFFENFIDNIDTVKNFGHNCHEKDTQDNVKTIEYVDNKCFDADHEDEISNNYYKEINYTDKNCSSNDLNNFVNDNKYNEINRCNDDVKSKLSIDPDNNSEDSVNDNLSGNNINNTNNDIYNNINSCKGYIKNECSIVDPDNNSRDSVNDNSDANDKDDPSISVIKTNINNAKNTKDKVKKKKKSKKSDSGFKKIILSLEEQKAELERCRREKKYIEAEFKCYNCAQSFLFKDTYQTHMMRHEESNGQYRCTTCTLRFVTPAVFRAHTSLHTDRYKCVRCGLMLRLRQCKAHAVECSGKSAEETVSCHLCGNVFKDSNGLSQHLNRFHKLRTKNRTYSCTICGNTYNNQAAVRTHMIKHIQRRFNCEHCQSVFSSPYTLKQHMKKHDISQQEKHFCTTCNIEYNTRKSLLAHRRNALVHQRTAFECKICAKLCPNRLAFTAHMQRVHASCKPYACNVCGKRYSSMPSLRRHETTHMPTKEVKLHMCHMCPRTFKNRSKLNRHLREVCEKNKLEEELSMYYEQNQPI